MKLKLSLPYKKIIVYAYFLSIVGSLTAIGVVGRFLYYNFYLTLGQSESLIDLGIKTSTETVNLKKFQAILEKSERAKATSTPDDPRDLFR